MLNQPDGKRYGGMYMYDATQVISIDAVDQYHALIGFSVCSDILGMTFTASATGAITDTANNGGTLRCTDVGHNLTTGQYVALTGMGDASHVGSTRVTVIDVDTFDCDDISYSSDDDTGSWQRGSYITVDNDGVYSVSFSASILSAGNNKNYKIEVVKNNTDLDEIAVERKIAVANDLGALSSSGIVSASAGDVFWLQTKCTTDDTNVTIEHANLNIVRI